MGISGRNVLRYAVLVPAAALAVATYRARHARDPRASMAAVTPYPETTGADPSELDAGPELESFSVEDYVEGDEDPSEQTSPLP